MNDLQFYGLVAVAIVAAIAIAWAIQNFIIDPEFCDRENHGWACKGKNCEGCYHLLPDGTREYTNEASYSRPDEAKSLWQ